MTEEKNHHHSHHHLMKSYLTRAPQAYANAHLFSTFNKTNVFVEDLCDKQANDPKGNN